MARKSKEPKSIDFAISTESFERELQAHVAKNGLPWEKTEREPRAAFDAFVKFLGLPPDSRDINSVAILSGIQLSVVEAYKTAYLWDIRAALRDQHVRAFDPNYEAEIRYYARTARLAALRALCAQSTSLWRRSEFVSVASIPEFRSLANIAKSIMDALRLAEAGAPLALLSEFDTSECSDSQLERLSKNEDPRIIAAELAAMRELKRARERENQAPIAETEA